jgi:hypothetical protein
MNKIKGFFKDEISTLKNELSLPEYLSWWLLRAIQLFVLVRLIINDRTNQNVLLLALNLLATFTVPLVRLLLFPKRIFTRLSFHAQTWLNVMIFFGSFLAQGMEWNHKVTSWDKVLHLMAGAVIVFIGDSISGMFLGKQDKISPLFRTYSSVGFSFIAIVVWEVFEFFADYYIVDSCNQAYNITPDRDPFFFAIFGYGVQNENQWTVFDTNVDMLCAVAGAIPAAVALWLWHRNKEKKKNSECKVCEVSMT